MPTTVRAIRPLQHSGRRELRTGTRLLRRRLSLGKQGKRSGSAKQSNLPKGDLNARKLNFRVLVLPSVAICGYTTGLVMVVRPRRRSGRVRWSVAPGGRQRGVLVLGSRRCRIRCPFPPFFSVLARPAAGGSKSPCNIWVETSSVRLAARGSRRRSSHPRSSRTAKSNVSCETRSVIWRRWTNGIRSPRRGPIVSRLRPLPDRLSVDSPAFEHRWGWSVSFGPSAAVRVRKRFGTPAPSNRRRRIGRASRQAFERAR